MINLSRQEIKEITGANWKSRQVEILSQLGVPFKIRADGCPIVSRLAYEQSMGLSVRTLTVDDEPDWEAIA